MYQLNGHLERKNKKMEAEAGEREIRGGRIEERMKAMKGAVGGGVEEGGQEKQSAVFQVDGGKGKERVS